MAVKLVFLGRFADFMGEAEREVPGPLDWDGLCAAIGPDMARAIGSRLVRIAVDGALVTDKESLAAPDGSEVALLPPVSGG